MRRNKIKLAFCGCSYNRSPKWLVRLVAAVAYVSLSLSLSLSLPRKEAKWDATMLPATSKNPLYRHSSLRSSITQAARLPLSLFLFSCRSIFFFLLSFFLSFSFIFFFSFFNVSSSMSFCFVERSMSSGASWRLVPDPDDFSGRFFFFSLGPVEAIGFSFDFDGIFF